MGVIICMILLVILCFIVLELEYEKGENKVSVTREDMLTKRSKMTIIEVKKKLEDKYYEIVDDFEQVISDFNLSFFIF